MQYTAASKKKGNAIRSKREWDIDHPRVQATVLNKKLTTSTLRLVAEKLSRFLKKKKCRKETVTLICNTNIFVSKLKKSV